MLLQNLQSFLNEVCQVLVLALGVIDLVPYIDCIDAMIRLLFLNMLNTGRICL